MLDASLAGLTLQVADIERSLEFYGKIPGATIVAHRPGEFALVQIGKGRLGLLNKQRGPTHIEIDTADLDALYHQLCAAGITPKNSPSAKPWDPARDFLVIDPDGHIIKFGEQHGERPEAQ